MDAELNCRTCRNISLKNTVFAVFCSTVTWDMCLYVAGYSRLECDRQTISPRGTASQMLASQGANKPKKKEQSYQLPTKKLEVGLGKLWVKCCQKLDTLVHPQQREHVSRRATNQTGGTYPNLPAKWSTVKVNKWRIQFLTQKRLHTPTLCTAFVRAERFSCCHGDL